MNEAEARIVAHVCSDGWLNKYIEKNALHIVNGKRYRQRRMRYTIWYCNTDNRLLKEFETDILNVYGLKCRSTKNDKRARSKHVYDRIKNLGGGSSYQWFIGNEILLANKNVKRAWIRAFFDDECTFDKHSKRIRVKCMNHNGLKQVRKLLCCFSINCDITGPNVDNSYYLTVPRRDVTTFSKNIRLLHKEKGDKIKAYLKSSGRRTFKR